MSDTFFVKTLTGKTITLPYAATGRVGQVKEAIHSLQGIPPAQQRLIFAGKQLQDSHTLQMCDVSAGATLHLVLSLREAPSPSNTAFGAAPTAGGFGAPAAGGFGAPAAGGFAPRGRGMAAPSGRGRGVRGRGAAPAFGSAPAPAAAPVAVRGRGGRGRGAAPAPALGLHAPGGALFAPRGRGAMPAGFGAGTPTIPKAMPKKATRVGGRGGRGRGAAMPMAAPMAAPAGSAFVSTAQHFGGFGAAAPMRGGFQVPPGAHVGPGGVVRGGFGGGFGAAMPVKAPVVNFLPIGCFRRLRGVGDRWAVNAFLARICLIVKQRAFATAEYCKRKRVRASDIHAALPQAARSAAVAKFGAASPSPPLFGKMAFWRAFNRNQPVEGPADRRNVGKMATQEVQTLLSPFIMAIGQAGHARGEELIQTLTQPNVKWEPLPQGRLGGVMKRIATAVLPPQARAGPTTLRILPELAARLGSAVAAVAGDLVAVTKKRTISARSIQSAVRIVLPYELARHAIAEATKAVVKATSRPAMPTGLHFPVSRAKAFAKTTCPGLRCGKTASTYFATVIEYVLAEVIEAAGKANCKKNRSVRSIRPIQFHSGIQSDEGLKSLMDDLQWRPLK